MVLVRLLLPVQLFTSDFGTGSVAQTVDIAEPVRQVYFSANENRYEQEYDIAFQKVVEEYEAANRPADPIAIEKTAQAMAQTSLEVDFKSILLHIWFAGMVVMTAVIISCNAHLALQLKRRRWALDIPESLLPVYVTEAVPTPCVFGFFRPAVYLTPEAAKEPQVRRHVLEHELTHYRHFDHVWSVLRSLCLVLHWYNPLVWIAAKVSRADAELACDEGALARLGEDQRGDYGRTLIGLTCSAPISDLLITATTMTGSAGSIRERIKLLMKRPRNTILTVTAVILMVTLIVGCTFAGAPETTQPTEPSTPGVDNDMAYEGQELPIPEEPGAAFGSVPYFNELLNPQVERSEADWFPRALTSCYDDPAQIDLYQLFYTGIPGADNTLTHEERTFLESRQTIDPEFVLFRIPAQEMDRVLTALEGLLPAVADSAEAVETMQQVRDIVQTQDTDMHNTNTKLAEVMQGIEDSFVMVNKVTRQTEQMDEARINVIDIVQSLTAISQENAAGTEETLASITLVNDVVKGISEQSVVLKDIAAQITEKLEVFRL